MTVQYKKVKVGESQHAQPLWGIWGKGSKQAIDRLNGIGKKEYFTYVPMTEEEMEPGFFSRTIWFTVKWFSIIVAVAWIWEIATK